MTVVASISMNSLSEILDNGIGFPDNGNELLVQQIKVER